MWQSGRGLILLALFFCAGGARAGMVSKLYKGVQIETFNRDLKLNEIYKLTNSDGANTGLVVITEIDGATASGVVIKGSSAEGEYLRDRFTGQILMATVTSYRHDVVIRGSADPLESGATLELVNLDGEVTGTVLIRASDEVQAKALVMRGDPEPGETVKLANVAPPARRPASSGRSYMHETPRAILDPPPIERLRLEFGTTTWAPRFSPLSGTGLSTTPDGRPSFCVSAMYERRLASTHYLFETGLSFIDERFTIDLNSAPGRYSINGSLDFDFKYVAVPLVLKWNLLSETNESELRLTGGLIYAYNTTASLSGQVSTPRYSTTYATNWSRNFIGLVLGLEFVLNARDDLAYAVRFDYVYQPDDLRTRGPRVLLSVGY